MVLAVWNGPACLDYIFFHCGDLEDIEFKQENPFMLEEKDCFGKDFKIRQGITTLETNGLYY